MTQVGLKIAKYIAIVRDVEGYGVSRFPITEQEYLNLKDGITQKLPFVWIHDIDGNKIRELNPKRDIKEFIPTKQVDTGYRANKYWICDYGIRHKILPNGDLTKCNCFSKLKIHPKAFFKILRDIGFKKAISKNDITDEMIHSYKSKYFINGKYE